MEKEKIGTLFENLDALQSLETTLPLCQHDAKASGVTKRKITVLRKTIPEPILEHYDRLRARGKKGVAQAEGFICRACYIAVPTGDRSKLLARNDVILCGNCGTYLYLSDVEAPIEA